MQTSIVNLDYISRSIDFAIFLRLGPFLSKYFSYSSDTWHMHTY